MSRLLSAVLILGAFSSAPRAAEAPANARSVTIRTTAEVEVRAIVNGRETVRLEPANRVVAGDRVIYTLAVRNNGASPADAVTFTSPIPRLMVLCREHRGRTGRGGELLGRRRTQLR